MTTTASTARAAAAVSRFAAALGAVLLAAHGAAIAQSTAPTDGSPSGQTDAASAEAAARGQAKYLHTCAPCHGRGPGDDGRPQLPGTAALAIKYRGALPAALEDRADLGYDMLRAFVRSGSWSMPPFRPTELTDDEIRDIAAYLAVSSQRAASRD